jgi:phosphohistidine phosphatase
VADSLKQFKNVKRVTRLKWTIINCFLSFNFVTSSLFNSITMKLYFLRHGQADWASWKKPDDERPLTKRGKREMRDVAKFLDRLKVRPDLIVTSPLPRAAQTAEIAADYLKAKVRKDESLAPGFGRSKLRTVVKRHRANVLMLVGHEPDFTNVIAGLTGASLKLSKAGVALVDVDPESEEAKLLWLLPPKIGKK